MNDINVLIVDDHNLFAKLIYTMLSNTPGIKVVGIAKNAQETLRFATENNIDIILLDINLPNTDGLQLLVKLNDYHPDIKTIMLSSNTEATIIQQSLKTGAAGYLTKNAQTDEVIDAINSVYNGENYFCKSSLESIMNNMINDRPKPNIMQSIKSLSKREKEVLKLIANEYSSTKISEMLNISVRTVQTHRKHLLQKLGAKNTVGLIKTAMEANLIN